MRIYANSAEGRTARAFLNDEDVSTSCTAADDAEGWVDLLVRDEDGRIVLGLNRKPVIERKTGNVRIELDVRLR